MKNYNNTWFTIYTLKTCLHNLDKQVYLKKKSPCRSRGLKSMLFYCSFSSKSFIFSSYSSIYLLIALSIATVLDCPESSQYSFSLSKVGLSMRMLSGCASFLGFAISLTCLSLPVYIDRLRYNQSEPLLMWQELLNYAFLRQIRKSLLAL